MGYLFAVLRVAVEPDQREWSKRTAAFYDLPGILPARHSYLEIALHDWLKLATEVIYSTRFTAKSVKENLGQFLRYYPDLVTSVENLWQGSNKDYEVLEQIFVQLKKEVADATFRLSKATKHRWGNESATADQEDNAQSKNKSKGNGGKGKGRRGSSTDAEKEPKKEDSRKRSASEPDISADWKKQNPRKCWQYSETGTCDFGKECKFEHDAPQVEHEGQRRGGRGSNSTQHSTSQNTSKGGTVRYAQEDDDDRSGDEDEDQAEMIIRLRKENAELIGRWLALCSSCSNANPNPAETGRVGRVLRTNVHRRGHKRTVRPVTNSTKTLDKSGGTQTKRGGH